MWCFFPLSVNLGRNLGVKFNHKVVPNYLQDGVWYPWKLPHENLTLPETNIEPENRSSQKETGLLDFQPSIFRCYVSFRECNHVENETPQIDGGTTPRWESTLHLHPPRDTSPRRKTPKTLEMNVLQKGVSQTQSFFIWRWYHGVLPEMPLSYGKTQKDHPTTTKKKRRLVTETVNLPNLPNLEVFFFSVFWGVSVTYKPSKSSSLPDDTSRRDKLRWRKRCTTWAEREGVGGKWMLGPWKVFGTWEYTPGIGKSFEPNHHFQVLC